MLTRAADFIRGHGHHAAPGGGGTGLLTNLVSYWKLEEASGSRADSNGANPLTDNGSTGNATGKIGSGASFTATAGNYLKHASNSDFSVSGATSLSYSFWVKFNSVAGTGTVVAKDGRPSPIIWLSSSALQFLFLGSSAYAAVSTPTLSTGIWYHIMAVADAANSQVRIYTNGGTPNTGSWNPSTNPFFAGSGDFTVGADSGGSNILNGIVDELGYWNGRALTDADDTLLYNGGSGLAFSSF